MWRHPSGGAPVLRQLLRPENGSPVEKRRVIPASQNIAGPWGGANILTDNV